MRFVTIFILAQILSIHLVISDPPPLPPGSMLLNDPALPQPPSKPTNPPLSKEKDTAIIPPASAAAPNNATDTVPATSVTPTIPVVPTPTIPQADPVNTPSEDEDDKSFLDLGNNELPTISDQAPPVPAEQTTINPTPVPAPNTPPVSPDATAPASTSNNKINEDSWTMPATTTQDLPVKNISSENLPAHNLPTPVPIPTPAKDKINIPVIGASPTAPTSTDNATPKPLPAVDTKGIPAVPNAPSSQEPAINGNQTDSEDSPLPPSIDIPTIDPQAGGMHNKIIDNDDELDINEQLTKSTEQEQEEILQAQTKERLSTSKDHLTAQEFIDNETKMLLLPNDDLVLGKITFEAKLADIDFLSYAKIVTKNYKSPAEMKYLADLNNFIGKYYREEKPQILPRQNARDLAFNAVSENNLSSLKVLLDNYNILQTIDNKGNNLLQRSVLLNNYFITKFLLTRGINTKSINYDHQNALDLARQQSDMNIYFLLEKQ